MHAPHPLENPEQRTSANPSASGGPERILLPGPPDTSTPRKEACCMHYRGTPAGNPRAPIASLAQPQQHKRPSPSSSDEHRRMPRRSMPPRRTCGCRPGTCGGTPTVGLNERESALQEGGRAVDVFQRQKDGAPHYQGLEAQTVAQPWQRPCVAHVQPHSIRHKPHIPHGIPRVEAQMALHHGSSPEGTGLTGKRPGPALKQWAPQHSPGKGGGGPWRTRRQGVGPVGGRVGPSGERLKGVRAEEGVAGEPQEQRRRRRTCQRRLQRLPPLLQLLCTVRLQRAPHEQKQQQHHHQHQQHQSLGAAPSSDVSLPARPAWRTGRSFARGRLALGGRGGVKGLAEKAQRRGTLRGREGGP